MPSPQQGTEHLLCCNFFPMLGQAGSCHCCSDQFTQPVHSSLRIKLRIFLGSGCHPSPLSKSCFQVDMQGHEKGQPSCTKSEENRTQHYRFYFSLMGLNDPLELNETFGRAEQFCGDTPWHFCWRMDGEELPHGWYKAAPHHLPQLLDIF